MSEAARLFPATLYHGDETVVSFAARLAHRHRAGGLVPFLQDIGVRPIELIGGKPAAVQRLGEVSGVSPAELALGLVQLHQQYHSLHGARFTKPDLNPEVRRICPQCVVEDGEEVNWRHRTYWCLEASYVCLEHSIILTGTPRRGPDIRDALSRQELADLYALAAVAPALAHEQWLKRRLELLGQPFDGEGKWLRTLSISQAMQSALMLGAVLMWGAKVKMAALTPAMRHRARAEGFARLNAGPSSIAAALDEIVAGSGVHSPQAGPLRRYGVLYDWLSRRAVASDPGPFRSVVRGHMLEKMSFATGEQLLGEVVTARRNYTVKSLAQELGIERRRMPRLLQQIGLVPAGARDAESGVLTFSAAQIATVLDQARTTFSSADARAHIGASVLQFNALKRMGIIQPVFASRERGAVRRIVFSQKQLDEVLSGWSQIEPLSDGERASYLSLASACRCCGGETEALLRLISNGKITTRRLSECKGLSAIFVHAHTAKRLLSTDVSI